MPGFLERPFAQTGRAIGGGLGAGAGGGLGSTLGKLLEPLDYPRQAVANLYRAATGQSDWESALPGLAGALVGGGLAATGVGAPLSLLAGSLVGGLGQGAGKNIDEAKASNDPDYKRRFDAPSVENVASSIGLDPENSLTNFAVGAATDPLSYIGGLGGAGKGAALGERLGGAYGGRLEGIAQHLGPGFDPDRGKLFGALTSKAAEEMHPELFERLETNIRDLSGLSDDAKRRIATELPYGSELLPHGVGYESIAFGTPQGGVAKVTIPREGFSSDPLQIPEMIQRSRQVNIPGSEAGRTPLGVQVSHEPRLIPGTQLGEQQAFEALSKLEQQLQEKGIHWGDPGFRNMGIDPRTGEAKILDPGNIASVAGLPTQSTPMQPGSWLERTLLGPWLQKRLRQGIAEETGTGGAIESYLKNMEERATPGAVSPFSGSLNMESGVGDSRLERMLGMPMTDVGSNPIVALNSPTSKGMDAQLLGQNSEFRNWLDQHFGHQGFSPKPMLGNVGQGQAFPSSSPIVLPVRVNSSGLTSSPIVLPVRALPPVTSAGMMAPGAIEQMLAKLNEIRKQRLPLSPGSVPPEAGAYPSLF